MSYYWQLKFPTTVKPKSTGGPAVHCYWQKNQYCASCCYIRRSLHQCWFIVYFWTASYRVCVSFGVLVTVMYYAKTAEPIDMPFGADLCLPVEPYITRKKYNFGGLPGPLKSIGSHCCGVCSKKSVTASA